MMNDSSSPLEEILDGMTGAQRQRIRVVLEAEGLDRLNTAEVRVLVDRINDEAARPSLGFGQRSWPSTGLGLWGRITRVARR